MAGTKIPDLNSGLRIFRKEVAQQFTRILPDGFSFTTTITLAMLERGYRVKYVPIDYHKRAGRSKIRPVYDTLNILQIAPRLPWPPTDGGAIGIYNITRFLAARGHRITLLTFASDSADRGDLEQFCEVITVPHSTRNNPFFALMNLFSAIPYTMSKYQSPALTARMDELLRSRSFDIVHVDHIHMMPYGFRAQVAHQRSIVLREHNFETTIHRRFAAQVRWPLIGAWLRAQANRLYHFESAQLQHPDIIAAITPEDAEKVRDVLPPEKHDRVRVIPAGVDVQAHRPRSGNLEHGAREQTPAGPDGPLGSRFAGRGEDAVGEVQPEHERHVVLLGSLDWSPNRDAAEWFVEDIWPRVRKEIPGARCTIAGSRPPKKLLRDAPSGVTVAGFVEDLDALYASADVMVVPLRIGGGMRIKLLEFFARGKAVVSTGIGAEGNEARDGEHILLADTAEDFAAAIVRLLRDAELARSMGAAARALVTERYSWQRVAELFEYAYRDALFR
ncbi:MAG: glycosyltransferase, partial [Bacteroidota bacterium]|nr:glycosyltransferase [Bacteroidota bacterium]